MKKTAVFTMAALCGCLSIVSCDLDSKCSGVKIARPPAPVCFIVEDASGNNLLDADYAGNILGNDISVAYWGGDYPLILSEYIPDEDDIMYTGLHTGGIGTDKVPGILFWYFYPTDDNRETTFTISWGNGTSDTVRFAYYYTLVGCEPLYHQRIYLNGVLNSDNSLTITIVK